MVVYSELIYGCKKNDRVAQKRLYDILLPYLNAVCRRYLSNPSDVKDTLQETFIKVFSNIHQYNATLCGVTAILALSVRPRWHRRIAIEPVSQQDKFWLAKIKILGRILYLKGCKGKNTMSQNFSSVFNSRNAFHKTIFTEN